MLCLRLKEVLYPNYVASSHGQNCLPTEVVETSNAAKEIQGNWQLMLKWNIHGKVFTYCSTAS